MKQRDGRVYDPIREKYVHATPEEYVRQKTIQFLIDYMEIPLIVKVVVSKKLKSFVALGSSCLSGSTMNRMSCK